MAVYRIFPFCSVALLVLAGCSAKVPLSTVHSETAHLRGTVHGGQQPVVGSTIQLYTVGTTAGGAPTPLLTQTVVTGADGSFDITGLYSCTSATKTYLTAIGGNPGVATANPNIAVMAALGDCTSLPGTFISINELTTVAAVYSLAPYMTSVNTVSTSDSAGIAAAFNMASQLVDTSAGTAPGLGVPSGYTVPAATINTLGDIIATCVNSAGGTTPDTACGQLFALATPAGSPAPTDTVGALLNLAKNPTLNISQLFGLVPATPPFVPALTSAPPDFRVRETPPASQIALQFSPASVVFGAVTAGSASSFVPVTITNSSSAAVTVGSITVAGTNAADFAVSTGCAATLNPASSCTVQIQITASGTGVRSAYLSVVSSSPSSPQYIALTATASHATPLASASATEIDFEANGLSHNVTLSNTGTGPLAISSIFNYSENFSQTSNCGSSLAAGASCIITVMDSAPSADALNVVPVAVGPYVDKLTIVTNDANFSGNVDLKAVNTGYFSASAIVVASGGATPLALDLGPSVDSTFQCPFLSTSGSGINIYFKGLISRGSDHNSNSVCSYTISYSGTQGIGAVNFGSAGSFIPVTGFTQTTSGNVTLTGSGPVTLSNYASTPLNIQSIVLPASFSQTNTCGTSLPAQSVCTITVTPPVSYILGGAKQGLLVVNDDAGAQTAAIASSPVGHVLAFGPEYVGYTSPLNFPVQIIGQGGVYGDGTNFPYASCASKQMGPCGFVVTFTPKSLGFHSFTASGGNSTFSDTYLETGTGTAAGPSITFGLQKPATVVTPLGPINGYNGYASIPLYYTGTVAAQVAGFTLSGPDANAFSASSSSPYAVTIDLSFIPLHYGVSIATLTVADINGDTASTLVYGYGTPAPPSESPTTLAFLGTVPNTDSPPQTISVSRNFNHPVTASVTGSASFRLGTAACTQDQSPCTLSVIFHPTAATNYNGTLTVTDTAVGLSSTVDLSGAGGIGVLSVSPTGLNFAARTVNSTSIPVPVTISNTGTNSLTFSGFTLTGTNASEFSLSGSCPSPLAVNASCTYNVTFSPKTAGSKTASFNVYSSVGNTFVPITGSAQ